MKPRNPVALEMASSRLRGRVKPMIRDRFAPSLQEGYDELEGHLLSSTRFPVGRDRSKWVVEGEEE